MNTTHLVSLNSDHYRIKNTDNKLHLSTPLTKF